ncbi:MAG TPA: tRNA (adenosine(37)-N6)-threonylcarbamoyltransferase complex ATPase subunit type 1 TsaE [Pseudomonadales bacterium]
MADTSLTRYLPDEAATLSFGAELLEFLAGAPLVFLYGQLGAGKTTLVRGILRALGHEGSVKSPTYTLLEPYEIGGRTIYHFDLYRIGDSEELDFIGIDELMDADAMKLVEWPERASARLPEPDVVIRLSLEGEGRRVEVSLR